MNRVLLNVKTHYDEMGKAEKKIADYVLLNPEKIPSLFITDLAALCASSEASVTRFSKRIGFEGFPQFKIALAQEKSFHPVSDGITPNDTPADVLAKVCNDVYSSLEKTRAQIDENALAVCCEKLIDAEKIFIFGLGSSSPVAQDAAHKLFRIGFSAVAYTDNHMQAIAATHADANTVVIGVSHSGRSRDIVESMKLAKDNGATTIAVTNIGKSPLTKTSDVILSTVSDETNYRVLGLSSRIAQLAIMDAIYSYLVLHVPTASEYIQNAENSLGYKKY